MRKRRNAIIIIAILLIIAIVAFFYFFVSGKTVANLFSEYENYEVTVIESSSIDTVIKEMVLTSQQKEMLKSLFRETTFSRVISSVVYSTDSTRFEIRASGTHRTQNGDTITGDIFVASSLGGKYLQISGAFNNGKHLRIHNSEWNARIDEILNISQKPFSDLAANDISSISVFAIPPNETVLVDDIEQIEQIIDILNTVIIYQKSDGWKDTGGQMVTFTISKATGEVMEVSAYNPHLIIDGQGYKTEYQPCENLNRIANTILGTRFGGQPIE